MITLDKLRIGKEGFIKSIECEDKALRGHILDMGLTPGVEVELIKTAPMGDPLEIRIRGYELTIRKADAAKIALEKIGFSSSSHKLIGESEEYDNYFVLEIKEKNDWN